ncbi:MAG: hypothetical protein IT356_05085 [Gemmatimonadaceae bacterium]|nr:hypothetical protein [Gemmatimonadaceae bacterium]
MADRGSGRREGIESLLAERKRYEAWIEQLDTRREATPAHVFDRVRSDYMARLGVVRGKLGAETGAIEEIIAELDRQLAGERDAVASRTDERAEAELRAAVGEFSEKEWNTRRRKLDDAIAELQAKAAATEGELDGMRGLLTSIRGAPAPARPSVAKAAVAKVESDLAADDGAEVGGASTQPAAGADAAGMILPADLMPVEEAEAVGGAQPDVAEEPEADEAPGAGGDVGATATTGADDGGVALAAGADEAGPRDEDTPADAAENVTRPSFDELAFLRSIAGTPTNPAGTRAVSARPATSPKPPQPEPDLAPMPESAEPPETMVPVEESGVSSPSPLGAPTPRTSKAVRSLKCQECGTLNFPTEWYCERCGGELAAF